MEITQQREWLLRNKCCFFLSEFWWMTLPFWSLAGIKAKSKKSWKLSLLRGSVRAIHVCIVGDILPEVKEKPLKSLGRLYEILLTDRHWGKEVQKVAIDGLKSIERTHLQSKLRAWCYKYCLLSLFLWPLKVYNILLFRIQQTQQYINKYLRKWFGVPYCFLTVGLHTNVLKHATSHLLIGGGIHGPDVLG